MIDINLANPRLDETCVTRSLEMEYNARIGSASVIVPIELASICPRAVAISRYPTFLQTLSHPPGSLLSGSVAGVTRKERGF